MHTQTMLTTLRSFVLVAFLCLGISACGSPSATGEVERNITVSGSSRVNVVPDLCSLSIGVTSEDADATTAQKENAKLTKKLTDRLVELGVDEAKIQTIGSDVSPLWTEDGASDIYEARTTLQVSDVAIDEAGSLMDSMTEAGASDISFLGMQTTDYEEAYQQALSQAVKATRPKAETIAEASGTQLGEIIRIAEGTQDSAYLATESSLAQAKEADAAGTELSAGEVEIEAYVTVTYALR